MERAKRMCLKARLRRPRMCEERRAELCRKRLITRRQPRQQHRAARGTRSGGWSKACKGGRSGYFVGERRGAEEMAMAEEVGAAS
eukprot:scaffold8361_cov118-Isochrysis_galbana.AAC.4